MEQLIETANRLIQLVDKKFVRALYATINWKSRLIEIKGARGVGKTTLMLQKAYELQNQGAQVLYVSLDNAYFFRHKLVELADWYYKNGGKYLFIDEVHKYPQKEKGLDWSLEIKNIYDSYPNLIQIYSGSSILQLYKGSGDLSRRKVGYHLPGLSFREYLRLNGTLNFEAQSFEDVIENHNHLAMEIVEQVKVIPQFYEYIKGGYYPFYTEGIEYYYQRLNEVTNVILETDIPSVTDVNFETSLRLKRLLVLLTSSVPYAPNLTKLSEQLFIADYRTLLKYLNYLEKAGLINTLSANASGNQIMNKPDKIYLDNSNLMHAFSENNINKGTLRETFLFNQLKANHVITYPKNGDFLVDGKYTLEVGGKNKTNKQLIDIDNAFIAMDDIETGFGNRIPLWLFGFLY
ncbi:MAG: AAA family ATPase [Salinivirgaceae bacterium]|jgi:predicted AAA+ superfamily ATPase|nr:AAA family ATPase [Salinivirgaceae bacterium]